MGPTPPRFGRDIPPALFFRPHCAPFGPLNLSSIYPLTGSSASSVACPFTRDSPSNATVLQFFDFRVSFFMTIYSTQPQYFCKRSPFLAAQFLDVVKFTVCLLRYFSTICIFFFTLASVIIYFPSCCSILFSCLMKAFPWPHVSFFLEAIFLSRTLIFPELLRPLVPPRQFLHYAQYGLLE